MLPLLVLLGTIAGAWYLLIVRPQKDQQTRHGRLVDQLQVGDHVLTVGGIYGRVSSLEGTSVVLELAPGLTSRIAVNGIARIVHGGEAALPTSNEPPRQALDTEMHQHQQAPQQTPSAPPAPAQAAPQFVAPAFAAPQQPYAPAQPAHAMAQPAYAPHANAYAYAPAPQPAHDPIPSFEPRPWGDVAPINAQPQQHAMPTIQQPAVPLHAPFAQPVQYAQPVPYGQPVQQVQYAQPAPVQYAPAPVIMAAPPQPEPQPEAQSRASRAPDGMGSRLRLDDPSLRDAMVRARAERAELAQEYRKLTAPLVDVSTGADPAHEQYLAAQSYDQQPMLVGHDPNGMPLFAAPGAPVVQPMASYPAPARIQGMETATMPRPNVHAPTGPTNPAFVSAAFQRRTPYATDPAVQPPAMPEQANVHAHA